MDEIKAALATLTTLINDFVVSVPSETISEVDVVENDKTEKFVPEVDPNVEAAA